MERKLKFPRSTAVRVLTRVLSDREPLDLVLAEQTEMRGWLQEICSGSLRWKGRLDQAIDSAALKKKPTGWLRKLLYTGAYQLIAQDRTPPAQIVSECVDEARAKEGEAPARFVNALLRKVSSSAREWRELPFPTKKTDQAQWASLPDWLWFRILKDHGEEFARAYALASLERPKLWVRTRENPGQATELRDFPEGPMTTWPGFVEGKFFAQDISSQTLVREIAARVRSASGPRPKVLDLCAAPGGKSAGLVWEGFEVFSTDRDEERQALLKQTLDRVAPEARILARGKTADHAPYDLVWVDAPCSGSGILRRHPDVRWIRQEKDLTSLGKLQRELLIEAYALVRPGGFLAYSVCSVLKEEGPGALDSLGLKAHTEAEWFLQPQLEPFGDGFWARLVRKSPD